MTVSDFDRIYPKPHGVKTHLERLDTGEGPVWIPEEGRLVFCEIGFSKTNDGLFRTHSGRRHGFDPVTGHLSLLAEPTNMASGMARDHQGRLVICEGAAHRVTRLEADGSITVIATHCDGKEFGSPNDIVVARDGGIYVTDSGPPSCVYHISADGSRVSLVAKDFRVPNGLAFSPDERVLYVNDSKGFRADPDFWMSRGSIRAFDVLPDGGLTGDRLFAVLDGEGSGAPDGMKVDVDGAVYCTGPRGIWVFAPGGEHLGVIETGVIHNQNNPTNLTWGGEDGLTLFITTSSGLLSVRTGRQGALFAQNLPNPAHTE